MPKPDGCCRSPPPSSSPTTLKIAKQQLGEFEILGITQSSASDRTVQMLDYCRSGEIDPIGFSDMWDIQKVLVQGQLDRTMEIMKLSNAQTSDDVEESAENSAEHSQFMTHTPTLDDDTTITQTQLGKDTVILLQHKPVYTLGTGSDPDFIKESGLSSSIDVVRIERGGEVTYHGPGQLVAYPILDLRGYKQDIHWYMRALEEAILIALESVGVEGAVREDDVTGIWIGGKKVAALGVKVRRWITMHGLAVNVDQKSLGNFDGIVPCGLVGKDVTCINDHLEKPITVEEFAKHMRKALEQIFEIELVDCPLVEAAKS
jgi:lipoyl(octanoyl) transferase